MNIELVLWGAAIEERLAPDWAAAEGFVDQFERAQLLACEIADDLGDDIAALRAQLRRALEAFRTSIDGNHPRELNLIAVRGLLIYFAGHEFGEGPPEGLAATMRLLGDTGVLEAAGFAPVP
jgi:hypothetical protein